jgi:hypothetical protein
MELGGFFELPEYPCCDKKRSAFSWLTALDKGTAVFVNDGRTAIKAVLENVQKKYRKESHIPTYLCNAILQPFEELNLPVTFYSHEHPLKPRLNGTIRNAIILLIDYFGAEPIPNETIREYLDQDNIVIVDNTHSLFNLGRYTIKDENYFLIASLRKMFPIPDGGIVYHNRNTFEIQYVLDDTPHPMLEAMILKRMYLECESKQMKEHFLRIYRSYDAGKFEREITLRDIPFISREMMKRIDIAHLIQKRKVNLDYCYRHITQKDIFLFHLKEIHSPFIVPLIFKDRKQRDEVRKVLIKNSIYPPVHWDITNIIPEKFAYEHELSRKILSIPIDQRYSETDMAAVVSVLDKVIS